MARSPILHLLRRSFAAARRASCTGEPILEVLQRADEARAAHRLSRREFLAAGAMAGGAAALSGCASLPRVQRRAQPDVLIVGAGLAGLTAAYRLTRAGIPARIIEAQDRVGGRCFSLRGHFLDDQVAELGGELIDSPHVSVQALCREFDIPLDDLAAAEDPALDRAVWFFGGQRYTVADICQALAPIAERMLADLAGLPEDASYRNPGNLATLDRMSIEAWLTRAGVSGWIRRLLEVAYTTEYGLEPGDQSALNLLWMINPSCPPFEIFGDSDERFHVRGGNDRMVSALYSHVTSLVDTGTLLESVRHRPDGLFELGVRRAGSSTTIAAPHVIFALPFTLLRRVHLDVELPPAKRRAIDELGYGTNAKLMVGFEARPWRAAARSAGEVFTDLPFQCTWETSRAQPGRSGILTNFTGGRHGIELGELDPAEQAYRLVADLERVFPGVAAARGQASEARFHWPSHPWTRGSYASYRPGQWTSVRGAEGERVGNLHFIGEHCSREFQGFMEGAVETGEAVAGTLIKELGGRARETAA